MTIDPDADDVRRAAGGDEGAFRGLFERHARRVLGLAARIAGNAADGEDILQETFIKAHRRLATFRFESTFSLWLYKIAVHEALNWATRRRTPGLPMPESEAMEPDAAATGGFTADAERMLAKLSAPLRAVMLLRYVHAFSYEEIADVLDLPVGTVRSRVHEAHERLRE